MTRSTTEMAWRNKSISAGYCRYCNLKSTDGLRNSCAWKAESLHKHSEEIFMSTNAYSLWEAVQLFHLNLSVCKILDRKLTTYMNSSILLHRSAQYVHKSRYPHMCLTDYDVLHLCAPPKLCALLHHGFAMPLARKATMILDFITGKSS